MQGQKSEQRKWEYFIWNFNMTNTFVNKPEGFGSTATEQKAEDA